MQSLTTLARAHLKLDEQGEDALLGLYVQAGIRAYETYTSKRLVPGVLTLDLAADATGTVCLPVPITGRLDATAMVGGRFVPVDHMIVDDLTIRVPVFACGCEGQPVKVRYCVGVPSGQTIASWMPDAAMGIIRYVAHVYMNRGDALEAAGTANPIVASGAYKHWQPSMRVAA